MLQASTVKLQIIIYSVILGLIFLTFPLWGIERPLGVLDDPVEGNTDLVYFATDAPDNIIVYSPGTQHTDIFSASERLGDMDVSPDGRIVWTATKSGFVDKYVLPIGSQFLQPESSEHKRIAPVLASIALSSDGRFVAVAYGNSEDYNARNVKILPANTIDPRDEQADFSVSGDIQDIVANPTRNFFYIVNSHSDRVRVYNCDRFRLEADIIELGNSPGRFIVRPDGLRGYGAMNARQSVTVVNLETNEVIDNIILGFPPFAMCFNPDGSRLYIASRDSTKVAVLDTETNGIITDFDLPPRLPGMMEFNFAEMIGVSSDEKYIYVMPKRPEFVVYDISGVFDTSGAKTTPTMVQSEGMSTTPFSMEIIRQSSELNPE